MDSLSLTLWESEFGLSPPCPPILSLSLLSAFHFKDFPHISKHLWLSIHIKKNLFKTMKSSVKIGKIWLTVDFTPSESWSGYMPDYFVGSRERSTLRGWVSSSELWPWSRRMNLWQTCWWLFPVGWESSSLNEFNEYEERFNSNGITCSQPPKR